MKQNICLFCNKMYNMDNKDVHEEHMIGWCNHEL